MGRARRLGYETINFLESSLAHQGDPEVYAQFRILEEPWNVGLKGLARVALLTTAENFPELTARFIGRSLPKDTTLIGAGGSSIVYKTGDMVTKVYKTSLAMSEADRQLLAAQETSRHDIMVGYLGSMVAPQTIDVGAHPIRPTLRAVRIRQQFFDFTDIDAVFPMLSNHINTAALKSVLSEQPALDESLHRLATASLAMARQTGLAPDVVAKRNLGYVGEHGSTAKLLVIDGQPVELSDTTDNYMLPQLEELRMYLDRPHAA